MSLNKKIEQNNTHINVHTKDMNKKELLLKCQTLGIKGCKNKTKEQIAQIIQKTESLTINTVANTEYELEDEYDLEDETSNDKTSNSNNNIKVILGDCLEKLSEVPNKSIQLICIDPPYNIGKDSWDTINNYNDFMMSVIQILETKLRDNGSFMMFHNDMEAISELMVEIKRKTKFVFRQMLVWNKRFDNSPKKGFMDGFVVKDDMHNWNKMCEYILFYTFDNSHKLAETRKQLGVNQVTISQEILSRTGGLTGWYSNLETGKNLPTRETIVPIEKHLHLTYDDIVPKFNNQKTHHSVWNYDMAKRIDIHVTPKPVELLKNIIIHTTDENDLVLDCFAGSGSMGYACAETKRQCILIEKEEKYYNYIIQQLKQYQ